MITRELLKKEIDHVQDEYLTALYKIIKSFEHSEDLPELSERDQEREDWHRFIDKFAGSLSATHIERGNQGTFEVREELQ